MNLSAIHIARWVSEASEELVGRTVTSLHKDEMRKLVSIELAGNETIRLTYLFLPGESLLCFDCEEPSQIRRARRTTNFLPQLGGTTVTAVEQPDFDRIVRISLSGQRDDFFMVFELFGPGSNVYLLDSLDAVITSLKSSPDDGTLYVLPERPGGITPYETDAERLVSLARSKPQSTLRSLLESEVRGCDRSFWDLAMRHFDQTMVVEEIDEQGWNEIARSIRHAYHLCTVRRHEVAVTETGIIWRTQDDDRQYYARLNDAVADAAQEVSYRAAVRSVRSRVTQGLRSDRKRLEDKLEKLRSRIGDSDEAGRFKQWAELLTVNISRIRKGMASVTVTNLYDENQSEIAIPLRKDLSPSANIAGLFRKYRKLVDGIAASRKQVSETETRLAALDRYRDDLERAADLTDFLILERSLVKDGIIKQAARRPSVHRAEPETRFNPRVFLTSSGDTILVGRNNRENEYVTFVAAGKNDVWFHSQQTPGSHVILKLKDKNKAPTHESIVEAAQIAAHFSQARTSAKVPVIYTEVKYIQKIKGGTPGKVKYSRAKSIMVEAKTPNRE